MACDLLPWTICGGGASALINNCFVHQDISYSYAEISAGKCFGLMLHLHP